MSSSITYPGLQPGSSQARVELDHAIVENDVIRCVWGSDSGRFTGLTIENIETDQTLAISDCIMPKVKLATGDVVDLSETSLLGEIGCNEHSLYAHFRDAASGLDMQWSVTLADESNAVVQELALTASSEVAIKDIVFFYSMIPGARQVGEVDGSVVVCGEVFMAVEHPLSKNVVNEDGHVSCALPLSCRLAAGETRTYTSVFGVVPPGQLRRGFLYYIERRRIHPYRQHLHYNNWYDVNLGRKPDRIRESECLAAIEYYGRELVKGRGVTMDAFVWDDGWDNCWEDTPDPLWGFHEGFPDGFRNLMAASETYGVDQGVWLSPNGGYATAKEARLRHWRPRGYETNDNGFAMGGSTYRKAFMDACLEMMRNNGVTFFKFDGMGEGGTGKDSTDGTSGELSDDIHAILELSKELHAINPEVYVSATAGTWASPFWLLYADSIWRQGGDTGMHGAGNTRQQWITYRDTFCYERVVQAGPLYPTNALMLHGIAISNRPLRAPYKLVLDEKSLSDEIWTFFASGTCLQELYISPDTMSDTMLDHLGTAANWARANEDVLVDTHWVGGNPGKGEVYGRAAWHSGKGILSLRNPSETEQTIRMTLGGALELPANTNSSFELRTTYPESRALPRNAAAADEFMAFQLEPFEAIVVEVFNSKP